MSGWGTYKLVLLSSVPRVWVSKHALFQRLWPQAIFSNLFELAALRHIKRQNNFWPGTNNEGCVKGCAATFSASDQFQHATNSTSSVKLVVVLLTSAMEPQRSREPQQNHQGEPLGDSQVDLRESPSGTLMGSRRTRFGKGLESYGLRDSTNCYPHCQPYVHVQMLTKLRLRSGEKIPSGYHDQN